MAKNIRYPIGIQTFSKIILDNYLYVDKTELVYNLAENYNYVFLSRPRRFGKSLLLSTFEAYFKGEKELFKGLEIEKLEKKWESYPVFRLDFSGNSYNHPERLVTNIESYINEFEKIYSIHTEGDIASRFRELIRDVAILTGKKVVILIDEYDKPMLDCMHDSDLHAELKAELRGFYSVIKASDQYIKFAMLTGITKFGKISIFSGLNNLKDISMLPRYNAICGISEKEFNDNFKESIASFADEHKISEQEAWDQFKNMYDGYHFASRGEDIYNPFSVMNAFDDNDLKSYWYASGSPSYLIRLIETNSYCLDKLEGERRTDIQLSDITDTSVDFVPLLFQSGYLTIKGYDADTEEYVLGFPNREVYKAFWDTLAERFFKGYGGSSAFNLRKCLKEVNEGRAQDFMMSMKSLISDTNSEYENNKEIHFQNMMAIAAKMMGLAVRTEIHSAAGRCDMQILTNKFVYILEFKIDKTPESALDQILKKGYADPFAGDSRTIILIGANFSTKKRTLNSWIIKLLPKITL